MGAESNIRFRVDAREALQQIRQMSVASGRLAGSVAQASTRLGGLQGIIGRLAVASTTRSIVNQAASYQQLQLRVKLLSKTYGETARLQAFAAKTARTFGMSSREALSGVTDLYARLRPMNITLEDIQTSFTGFNSVARLSGLTAAQSAGAFFQLSQALGSGRLQGDEFRSISEQVPGLLTAIAKETGIAQTKLKEYASQGKLTSDIIINALRRAEKEGGAKLKELVEKSPVQAFKNLSNAVEDLSISIGSQLIPVVVPLLKALTGLVRTLNKMPDWLKLITAAVLGLATAYAVLLPVIGAAIIKTKALTAALNTQNGTLAISAALTKGPWVAAVAAAVMIGLQWWEVTRKQKEEQAKLNDIIKAGTAAQQRDALAKQEKALIEAQKKLERMRKSPSGGYAGPLGIDAMQQKKVVDELEESIDKLKEALSRQNEEIDKAKGRVKGLTELYGKFDKRLKDLVDPVNQIKTHSENMGQAFGSAFKGIIDGSMSAGEALVSFFKKVADSYLQMAADIAAAASTKFFAKILGTALGSAVGAGAGAGAGAGGGPVTTGSVYVASEGAHWKGGFKAFDQGGVVNEPTFGLVGEGGESEYIIPESKMGDAMARYAGGARGDAVLAGGGEAGGEGGVGGASSGVIDVTFNTQVINDVSYVSYAEFQTGVQQAAAEGAKRGEQATLRRLQNSPSTRRRVGV